MSFPGSRDWNAPLPDTWVDGHDWIAEAPQHAPDPFQSTLPLPMHWEDGSQSVDSVSLISSIQPSPNLLSSAPIVAPSAPDQAGEQPLSLEHRHFTPSFTAPLPDTLIWPTNEKMPLGCNPDEHSGITDSPIIHHTYGTSVSSPSERFDNSSGHEVHVHKPMTGTNPDTRGRQTVRRRTINTRARHDGVLKCGRTGCTYTGTFSRKSSLKRHIDTQHIYPGSYECPESECGVSFNRRDNLDDHVRRVHLRDI